MYSTYQTVDGRSLRDQRRLRYPQAEIRLDSLLWRETCIYLVARMQMLAQASLNVPWRFILRWYIAWYNSLFQRLVSFWTFNTQVDRIRSGKQCRRNQRNTGKAIAKNLPRPSINGHASVRLWWLGRNRLVQCKLAIFFLKSSYPHFAADVYAYTGQGEGTK